MLPPRSTASVGHVKPQASRTQASRCTGNPSATASVLMQTAVHAEEASSPSESEAALPATVKPKEISTKDLSRIAVIPYQNVPALMNIPLMQKICALLRQDLLDALIVQYRFGSVDLAAWKVVGQFRREPSPNEAHSYAYI